MGGHGGATFQHGAAVDHAANGFDPATLVRDLDYGTVTTLPVGRVQREWKLVAEDREIEIAPGVRFAAWTFNGRIPGPTLRCTEGELLKVRFVNGSEHPHTMHFHGVHAAEMVGVPMVGRG
jgi:FtsP/CotA-like multicopper oxidase with cupredoxin domain